MRRDGKKRLLKYSKWLEILWIGTDASTWWKRVFVYNRTRKNENHISSLLLWNHKLISYFRQKPLKESLETPFIILLSQIQNGLYHAIISILLEQLLNKRHFSSRRKGSNKNENIIPTCTYRLYAYQSFRVLFFP